jgi:SAM-dependent methyltransferase
MQNTKCLLCDGIAELKHNEFVGYQEPLKFKIYCCKNCNTAFSMPRIEADEIYENIYRNGHNVPGYDRYWKYMRAIKDHNNPFDYLAEAEETYWGVREALNQVVKDKQSSRVLEIGSGLGYLTYSLRKAGYNALGIDISQAAVNLANKTFGNFYILGKLAEYAQTNIESFDIVILTEVIEHINEPIKFISSILKLLKPNGRVIITTPNKSSYLLEIIWQTDLPPVHCWWFSEESMKYMANKMKLGLSFINFRAFHKKNYRSINNKKCQSSKHKPILDKTGKLINENVQRQDNIKSSFRLLIYKVPLIKKIYRGLRDRYNLNIVVCNDRGTVLCAILNK